jgi:hypothetical protein
MSHVTSNGTVQSKQDGAALGVGGDPPAIPAARRKNRQEQGVEGLGTHSVIAKVGLHGREDTAGLGGFSVGNRCWSRALDLLAGPMGASWAALGGVAAPGGEE